ncbi:MAG: DUF4168 domain-containing protein [Thioalkalivibrio sp.]
MTHTFRKLPLALALAAAFGFSAAAHAQGQPQQGDPSYGAQPPAGMEQQQSANVDPQTLDKFVDAFVAVQEIRQDFAKRLQSVEDETEAQSMQQEAQEEMIGAVEDKGLNVEQYNQVAMALQSDPAMMQRVQQMAEERM